MAWNRKASGFRCVSTYIPSTRTLWKACGSARPFHFFPKMHTRVDNSTMGGGSRNPLGWCYLVQLSLEAASASLQ